MLPIEYVAYATITAHALDHRTQDAQLPESQLLLD